MTKSKINFRYTIILCLAIFLFFVLPLAKYIWINDKCAHIGSFETEYEDITQRRNYLIEKIIVSPAKLLEEMPAAVGPQFQGEWALYSCSMLSAALTNIALIFPETKDESLAYIDSLINIVLSKEIRQYDTDRWGEDPLETLDGDKSHISYLSHLAWMVSGYKQLGGSSKYDHLYDKLCETMNRRITASPTLNLETYPGECIYIPDMLVAIVALENYSRQNGGKYCQTVQAWLDYMQEYWIDDTSGLLASMIPVHEYSIARYPIKGSYSALSCYYLTFIDEDFAHNQYLKLKEIFLQKKPFTGFRENIDGSTWLGFDIDAGPIIFNLSPTGTAFGIGPATYFKDSLIRTGLLRTAEIAGSTITTENKSHYLLADIALVGEAITLAMRTATPWI